MQSALIVSSSTVLTELFTEMLAQTSIDEFVVVKTCGEARRLLIERSFDLCIINSPLPDETGFRLSTDIIGSKCNQVILVLKQEIAAEIAEKVEDYGVFTVEKPLSKPTFWTALKMASAAFNRLNRVRSETDRLKKKLDELKLISRAKILLIEKENLTEEEAHKRIEKEAMDYRLSRVQVAMDIINLYEE